MTVDVLGWSHASAVALVDDVRVRIRRTGNGIWWICDHCGRKKYPHCVHARALAETPAEPAKRKGTR